MKASTYFQDDRPVSGSRDDQPCAGESGLPQIQRDHSGAAEISEYEAIRARLTVEGGSTEDWPCLVWSIAPGYVRLTLDVAVPKGGRVNVRFCGGWFEGVVAHCVAQDRGFRVGIQLAREYGEGHRRDPRFPVHSYGRLTLVGSNGVVWEEIEVTDVSATGLGILIRPALRAGAVVMIELQAGVIFGEVRHCEAEGAAWHRAGIGLGDKAQLCWVASQFIWKLRKGSVRHEDRRRGG